MSPNKVPTLHVEEHNTIPRGAVWLSNGDLILCAKPTNSECDKTHLMQTFRVHRELLSQGLDRFPIPPMVSELIPELQELHGLPVVTIPERGEDLELILRVLYNLEAERHLSNQELPQLERLITICNVYHFPLVLTKITENLHVRWPDLLAQWDSLERKILSTNDSSERISVTNTASFISFARKHGMQSLLPAAFYDLTRIEGWEEPVLPSASAAYYYSQMRPNPMCVRTLSQRHRIDAWSLLSSEDGRVLSCVEHAKEAGIRLLETFRPTRNARREDHHGCANAQRGLCTVVAAEARKTKDVLTVTRRHLNVRYMIFHGSCLPCAVDMVHTLNAFRRSFWKTLVAITGTE